MTPIHFVLGIKFTFLESLILCDLEVDFSNLKAQFKGDAVKMKLNVIFVFRTINSTKREGVHFYITDINFSGNQGVNPSVSGYNLHLTITNVVHNAYIHEDK